MIEHKPMSIVLVALLFFLIAVAIYYPGFDAPMYYDSLVRLQGNEYLFCCGFADVVGIFPQRPLSMASFYLNYLIAGMSPISFRVCNAGLMALTAVSAMILAFLILVSAHADSETGVKDAKLVAFLLGLIFLVHPIQTYLVVYVWQRMALLACLFYFSALAVYLGTRTGRIGNRVLGYSIFSILSVGALASKENAITLPLVLILTEIALLRSDWRSLIKPIGVASAAMLVFLVALFFLERPHGVGEASGFLKTVARYYREGGLSLTELALSQCRVMFSYLEMIAVPLPGNVRLFDAQIISKSIVQPPATSAAVAGVAAFLCVSFYLLRKRPAAGFGLLFFVLNLLPESFLVPQYLFFGYRPALSMFGLLLAIADLCLFISAKPREARGLRWLPVAMVLFICVGIVGLCVVTRSKAELWKDPVAFWGGIVAAFPPHDKNVEKHVRLQSLINLALGLESQGRHDEAIGLLKQVLAIDPKEQRALLILGRIYGSVGNLNEARSCYEQALAVNPDFAEALVGLGEILLREGGHEAAQASFQKALDAAKGNPVHSQSIGDALMRSGDPAAAVYYFRRAVDLHPCSAENHYGLAKALMATGDIANAVIHLEKTVGTRPDHWKAHNDLGVIFAKRGVLDKAVAHFEAAVRIKPEDVPSRRNLETALHQLGRGKGP